MNAPLLRRLSLVLLSCAALPLIAGAIASPRGEAAGLQEKPNRYIGASKCKSCHSDAEKGDQYGTWSKADHAKAFDVLATPEALEVGKAHGVAEPQTDAKCLKCHTTAYGEPEEAIKKGFKFEDGVSCETCHGPGENHQKGRFAAAMAGETSEGYTPPPEGEILSDPTVETCLKCHNKENPTFTKFCYFRSRDKINHMNPKKPRSKEELDNRLVCETEGDTCTCSHDLCIPANGCGVKASEKK